MQADLVHLRHARDLGMAAFYAITQGTPLNLLPIPNYVPTRSTRYIVVERAVPGGKRGVYDAWKNAMPHIRTRSPGGVAIFAGFHSKAEATIYFKAACPDMFGC